MVISPLGILLLRDRHPYFVFSVGYKMSQNLFNQELKWVQLSPVLCCFKKLGKNRHCGWFIALINSIWFPRMP